MVYGLSYGQSVGIGFEVMVLLVRPVAVAQIHIDIRPYAFGNEVIGLSHGAASGEEDREEDAGSGRDGKLFFGRLG